MDQQTVEGLLRRLAGRVEESERHHSRALDELRARLDQLSQTTDAARAAGSPEDAATFDRLHDQVSSLARRLEGEASTPLDDFERLGRALSGDFYYGADLPKVSPSAPDLHGSSPFAGDTPFRTPLPKPDYSTPFAPSFASEDDLDKRLVDMAHRLEHSIDAAILPHALDALNTRLDELGSQIAKALENAPKGHSFEPLESQISDMAQQLGRVKAQFAKLGEIESALNKLIQRVDASPSPEQVASEAAQEAARLVADEAKLSAPATERLDAMHRDLRTMNDRTRASDDKLAGTIEAVHESLKQLLSQIEKNPSPPAPPKPRVPFAERMRDLAPLPEAAAKQPSAELPVEKSELPRTGVSEPTTGLKTPKPNDSAPKDAMPKDAAPPKNRLAAAIADLEDNEVAPHFGRAKRSPLEDKAFDLAAPAPRPGGTKRPDEAAYDVSDDLVAAARRAAQAAARKAEERSGGSRVRRLPGDANLSSAVELPSRRKRSFLIISATVLLALSALLLYGRLRSKPEPEVTAPAAEQSEPAPSAPSDAGSAPGAENSAPGAVEPKAETPFATPDSSELQQEIEASPADSDVRDAGQMGNFIDVAKSSYRNASATEPLPQPQPASLTTAEMPTLSPGVVFSVETPNLSAQSAAGPVAPSSSMPSSLPLPPPDLGPLALRQAAAEGDTRAQFAIAFRYMEGQGTPQNLTEAAHWLERAASAGLAPAQYRLAVMYEHGQGMTKDLGRARSWYQAAAEKGNVKAMYNLAVSLSAGATGTADYAIAAKWYGEAAAYGLADSQFNLGILAEHGLGMPKNLSEAYKWFALAAKSGDHEAAQHRDLVKAQLDTAALSAVEQAIAAWTPKQVVSEANGVEELPEWAEASAPNTALVTRAQNLLKKLGYDASVPDGLIAAKTREAIKSFERKSGLEETGKVPFPSSPSSSA